MDGKPLSNKPYALLMPDGSVRNGITVAQGRTQQVETNGPQTVNVFLEDADHEGFYITEG